MPGPAPKHPSVRARRNNDKAGFTQLPPGGRKGPVPPWPLLPVHRAPEVLADAEQALWIELWGTPQAVVWEKTYAAREVAQYVRWKVRAEQGDGKAAVEARLLSDRLGLNPLALMRLRLEILAVDAAGEKKRTRRTAAVKKDSTPPVDPREFLRAVN